MPLPQSDTLLRAQKLISEMSKSNNELEQKLKAGAISPYDLDIENINDKSDSYIEMVYIYAFYVIIKFIYIFIFVILS